MNTNDENPYQTPEPTEMPSSNGERRTLARTAVLLGGAILVGLASGSSILIAARVFLPPQAVLPLSLVFLPACLILYYLIASRLLG